VTITADIAYLHDMPEDPISHAGYPDLENLNYDWRTVRVADADEIPGGPSLRQHGFCKLPYRTRIAAFDRTDSWHPQFGEEVVELVKRATGATEVIVPLYSATLRSVNFEGSYGPASFCHNDFTSIGAARHISQLVPDRAEDLLSRRFAAYNVWGLVSEPPQDVPLALCDATSVTPADMFPGQAFYGGHEQPTLFGYMSMFRYNPRHRWYYFPKLTSSEILIWCGYDADPDYASIVPHTAFRDKSVADTANPRFNVECRCYAFFN
jgi:hypothetical protein